MTPSSIRISLAALTLFAAATTGDAQVTCPSYMVGSAYPGPTIATTPYVVGWNLSNTTMQMFGQNGPPAEFPLGLQMTDNDEVLAFCANNCTRIPVLGEWTANWSLFTPSGKRTGDFRISNAISMVMEDPFMVSSVSDATLVLYTPPRDFALGEWRNIEITAQIVDLYPTTALADVGGYVVFKVLVMRRNDGKWDVSVYAVNRVLDPEIRQDCAGTAETVCELLHGIDPVTPPGGVLKYGASPSAIASGEFLTERSKIYLSAVGADTDMVVAECGTPPSYNPPAQSIASIGVGDRLNYAWTFITGTGSFLVQGKSTVATVTNWQTTPGLSQFVDVRLTITDSTGEPPVVRDYKIFRMY